MARRPCHFRETISNIKGGKSDFRETGIVENRNSPKLEMPVESSLKLEIAC